MSFVTVFGVLQRLRRLWSVFAFLLLALVLFIWLSTSRHAHWPARIELSVHSPVAVTGHLRTRTANGFVEKFVYLGNAAPFDMALRRLSIRNVASVANSGASPQVTPYRLKLDGRALDLNDLPNLQGELPEPGTPILVRAGESLEYKLAFQNGELRFMNLADSGLTEVWVDDRLYARFSLYSHQASDEAVLPLGQHLTPWVSTAVPLPIAEIRGLSFVADSLPPEFKVLSAQLVVERGEQAPIVRELQPVIDRATGEVRLEDTDGFRANLRPHRVVVLARAVLAFGLVGVIALGLMAWHRTRGLWKLRRNFLLMTCIASLAIGAGMVAAWPAVIQTDSMSVWSQVKYLNFDTWFSHSYSFFVLVLSLLYDSPAVLTLLQGLLTIFLFAGTGAYCLHRGANRFVVWGFFLFGLCSLPVLLYPAFFVRDVLYAVLSLAVFLILHGLMTHRRLFGQVRVPVGALLGIGLVTGTLALIRAEGAYLLLAVPFALQVFVTCRWRDTLIVALAAGVLFVLCGQPLKQFMAARNNPDYALTLAIEPLGEIVSGPYLSADYERDRAVIEKVISFDDLVARHRGLEAFWSDRFLKRGHYGEQEIRDFTRLTAELALRNPDKFLSNRVRIFSNSVFANTGNVEVLPSLFNENGRQWGWDWVEDDKYRLAVFASAHASPVLIAFQRWVNTTVQQSLVEVNSFFGSPRNWFWSEWFSVLLLLLVMSQWMLFPCTALFSGLLLIRVLLLFMLAPMSHFKYFADVCLAAPLILPLVAVDWCLRGLRSPQAR